MKKTSAPVAQATPATPAPEVVKAPTVAEKCLAAIPQGMKYRTNAKGHIFIQDTSGSTVCRIRALKDGMYIFPGKALKATREDWEHHPGWINEYAMKVGDWAAATKIIEAVFEKAEPAKAEPKASAKAKDKSKKS